MSRSFFYLEYYSSHTRSGRSVSSLHFIHQIRQTTIRTTPTMNDVTRFWGRPCLEMPLPAQIDAQPQAPQQKPPQTVFYPFHSGACPVAAAARKLCTHVETTLACAICLRHTHADATQHGWLRRLCICESHNPTPGLDTPAGRQRLADVVKKSGAKDLETLDWARQNVTLLVGHMDAALDRILQARMAGVDFINADDICVITEAGLLLSRLMPRMNDLSGGFSLDSGRITIAPCHVETSGRGHAAVNRPLESRAARQSMADFASNVLKGLESRAQEQKQRKQQQQQAASPLVVNGSAPHPSTTKLVAPGPAGGQLEAQV